MPTREEIEAKRGIVRDEQGRIIRSTEWIKERVQFLKTKKEDISKRLKNIEAEIKYRELELSDKGEGVEE